MRTHAVVPLVPQDDTRCLACGARIAGGASAYMSMEIQQGRAVVNVTGFYCGECMAAGKITAGINPEKLSRLAEEV